MQPLFVLPWGVRVEIQFVDRTKKLTQKDRESATRRLIFTLARYEPEIRRVKVITEDIGGPHGDVSQCVLTLRLRNHDVIEACHDGANFGESFALSANRMRRSVARKLELRHTVAGAGLRTMMR